jgi:hypothetical protein
MNDSFRRASTYDTSLNTRTIALAIFAISAKRIVRESSLKLSRRKVCVCGGIVIGLSYLPLKRPGFVMGLALATGAVPVWFIILALTAARYSKRCRSRDCSQRFVSAKH